MKLKMKLDLRLFDEGGAAGEAGAAGAEGGTGDPAAEEGGAAELTASEEGGQGAESKEAGELTAEQRSQAFQKLISGEYQEEYQRMLGAAMERQKTEVSRAQEQINHAMGLLNLIGSKYGITDGNLANIQKAVESDDAYWEDAAAKEGLSVEQFKRMKKLEAENREIKLAKENAERLTQKNNMYAKWNGEAEQLKGVYAGFNLKAEMQNPDFVKLLGAGIDMRTIYETLHHDEIMSGAMAYTAKTVAKKQADAIRSGQKRPGEVAAQGRNSFQGINKVESMSKDKIMELARRSLAGETITLEEMR